MKHQFFLTLATCYLTLISFAFAQGQAGSDIAVLKAGVGARPLGMGGAFTAVADNADANFYNPAGLSQITKNEITTSQTKLSTDTDHYYISYVRPAFGGAIGISWIQIGLGTITQTSSEVNSNNEVQTISVFSYFSNAYLLSYGKELNNHISAGLTAKYLTSDMFQIAGGQAYGYSLSPGIMIRLRKGLQAGVKIDELINQQSWGTGTAEKVPPVARIGLAYKAVNPGLFAIDLSQILKSGYSTAVSLGYEWAMDGLSLRIGYMENGLTAGAGFIAGHARVDYAYVSAHRVSLSANW